MSDGIGVNVPVAEDVTVPTDGGNLFRGSDGKLSLRRISGATLIALGVGFLAWAMATLPIATLLTNWFALLPFAPGIFLIAAGLFCYQLFTLQNVKALIGK